MKPRLKGIRAAILFLIAAAACVPYQYPLTPFEGRQLYIQANMWYENPLDMHSVNHHRGTLLPLGTLVTITQAGPYYIEFKDASSRRYRYTFIRKYSGRNITLADLFSWYFDENDPLSSTRYQALSEAEQESIRQGRITLGMSKEAVVLAYGYPPTHKTPSLENDVWIYWISKFTRQKVFFQNGRVVNLTRGI